MILMAIKPGGCPTNDISIEFEIRLKFEAAYL